MFSETKKVRSLESFLVEGNRVAAHLRGFAVKAFFILSAENLFFKQNKKLSLQNKLYKNVGDSTGTN